MTDPRPSGDRLRRAKGVAVAAALFAVVLGGCSTQGDFGEVRPMLVSDGIHDWMSPTATGKPASQFELTDDERLLRDLGYPLIEPPYDRKQWYSVLNEYGHNAAAYRVGMTPVQYANSILSPRYRSPAGRYGKLIEDVRNDITRMPPFFDVAGRVLSIDVKRQQAMAYVPSLTPGERANALRRIRENAAIVRWTQTSLVQRCAAYRFTLGRLVIATPSPQAAEADRLIGQCEVEVGRYRIGPPPVSKTERVAAVR
jgi:hypothetical protein